MPPGAGGSQMEHKKRKGLNGLGLGRNPIENHSMAPEGHSSMQAPQSTQADASMTATSPIVIAEEGQASAHTPHATHSDSLIVGILITS